MLMQNLLDLKLTKKFNMMKIQNNEPDNWQALQNNVAEILAECGYKTFVEKTIQTVRGNVEIDVFAEKTEGFKTIILCECKYWDTNIPQHVIHALRTVVNDS